MQTKYSPDINQYDPCSVHIEIMQFVPLVSLHRNCVDMSVSMFYMQHFCWKASWNCDEETDAALLSETRSYNTAFFCWHTVTT